MSETKTMTKVNRETPSISRVRRTIQVKQGNNAIYMTKNDVNMLRMLQEGQFDGSCCSSVEPRTRYVVMSGCICGCKDTNFLANHNQEPVGSVFIVDVYAVAKIRIF